MSKKVKKTGTTNNARLKRLHKKARERKSKQAYLRLIEAHKAPANRRFFLFNLPK